MTAEEVQQKLIDIDPRHALKLGDVQRQLDQIAFTSPTVEEMLESVASRYTYKAGRGFPVIWLHRLIISNSIKDRKAHPEKYVGLNDAISTPISFLG
jgi:hypothetical protein